MGKQGGLVAVIGGRIDMHRGHGPFCEFATDRLTHTIKIEWG
jgi:hypothetical protein